MPREISDEEYAEYMQARQIKNFVEPIFNDPRLNPYAKTLIKAKYPNLSIPDHDLKNEITQHFNAEKKRADDEKAAEKQKQEDQRISDQRANVQKQYGFTDDGMKDLEKFMVDNHVGSYEVAAGYKVAKEPKPIDPTNENHFWQRPALREQIKEISADPEGWARKELTKAARADEQRMKQQFGG
jgi:hypothetical protein